MSRSPKQPILSQEKLKTPEKYLRFATPEKVAMYRAEKLKCNTLLEIGSAIGGQTIAFSKFCRKIIAVEISREHSEILKKNLEILNIKNVDILTGDALSEKTISAVKKQNPEIIFCDTSRKEQGKRTLKELTPNIFELLEKYSKVTDKIAVEIPPFTNKEELNELRKKYDFEEEYLSLNKQLNRLTLYFNELKKSEKTAITLPSKEKIESQKNLKIETAESLGNFEYLYTIDAAIITAGLENELANNFNSQIINLNKPCLISDKTLKSSFITGYKILKISEDKPEEILKCLKILNAGKVVLRYNIEPKEYWKIRSSYENQLSGKKEVHLFKSKKEDLICEKI